jgi:hypothetical protein
VLVMNTTVYCCADRNCFPSLYYRHVLGNGPGRRCMLLLHSGLLPVRCIDNILLPGCVALQATKQRRIAEMCGMPSSATWSGCKSKPCCLQLPNCAWAFTPDMILVTDPKRVLRGGSPQRCCGPGELNLISCVCWYGCSYWTLQPFISVPCSRLRRKFGCKVAR